MTWREISSSRPVLYEAKGGWYYSTAKREGQMNAGTESILTGLMNKAPELAPCRGAVVASFDLLLACFAGGGKVLTCGNGGSAADAEHIVGELMKSFVLRRKPTAEQTARLKRAFPDSYQELAEKLQQGLPAISLVSQTALCSAIANDVASDMVYAQQVFGYGRPGDLLIAISTSGKSSNVVNAAKAAKAFGLHTIALTGPAHSTLSELATAAIRAPGDSTALIQEFHLRIYHALCAMVEHELFGGGEQ